jgi:hypothetical protein
MLTTIIRYILIEKIGLDIKQTYDFFYLFISTGIFVGIFNFIYEDTYMSFTSGGELPPTGGNISTGVGGAGIGNPVGGQALTPAGYPVGYPEGFSIEGPANPPE